MRDTHPSWLEDRTGVPGLARAFFQETLPGGARWRYVFGHALAASFLIQLVTGLLLMSSYVPSASQAWGSVWYVQNQMVLGWFIRGLHHWGSSAVMVLLGLHLVQGIVYATYRAPREVNWWVGLAMMGVILGLALTGYLLPWDQKGYWATKVATNIAGSTPVLGPQILAVLVGGSEYGNQTLTRLFSLHVGVLPLTLLGLLLVHILLYYRHGATPPARGRDPEPAWPGQIFRNLVSVAVVLAVLVGITLWNHGANLEAPADPATSDYPARPEWYFLPLFQLLNYFRSPYEVIGTHILPGFLFAFLAGLPLLDRVLPGRLVHAAACVVILGLVGGGGFLMAEAVLADRDNKQFLVNREKADQYRERALQLAAAEGVPPDGAIYLLRRDPMTHGREVLEQNCLSCHHFGSRGGATRLGYALRADDLAKAGKPAAIAGLPEPAARAVALKVEGFQPKGAARAAGRGGYAVEGTNAAGETVELTVAADGGKLDAVVWSKQTASDLKDFGSRAWIRGLLENPSDPRYFGATPALDGMKTWKKGSKLTSAELDQVSDFLASFRDTPAGQTPEEWYEQAYSGKLETHPGNALFVKECGKCHVVGEAGLVTEGGFREAPDLFGYGSRSWIARMIQEPGSESLYGYLDEEARMPAFAGRFTDNDMETLVSYLRGEYLPPAAVKAAGAGATEESKPARDAR